MSSLVLWPVVTVCSFPCCVVFRYTKRTVIDGFTLKERLNCFHYLGICLLGEKNHLLLGQLGMESSFNRRSQAAMGAVF